jgi:hypothetical protein
MIERRPMQEEEAPPPSNEDDWGLDETGDLDDEVAEKLPRPPV